METQITLQVDDLFLEGRLGQHSPDQGVVVTHPHPLYGGDMDNHVVMCAVKAYIRAGWSTLRFNFRGTGRSSGRFDEGAGEQRDLQSAITFLENAGYPHIDLVGYSFGSALIAGWSMQHPGHVHRLVFISPPVAFMAFPNEKPPPGLHCIITGSADEIAPADNIRTLLRQWRLPDHLFVVHGADHSYFGYHSQLIQILSDYI